MRDTLRERLNTEVTRQQFLQYLGTALLIVFGFNNIITLLTGSKPEHHLLGKTSSPKDLDGFGTRRFGK